MVRILISIGTWYNASPLLRQHSFIFRFIALLGVRCGFRGIRVALSGTFVSPHLHQLHLVIFSLSGGNSRIHCSHDRGDEKTVRQGTSFLVALLCVRLRIRQFVRLTVQRSRIFL